MTLRSLTFFALFWILPPAVRSQDDSSTDRELESAEARLQEQRATAVRDRLILYTDELQKLHGQFTASGDAKAVAAVKQEQEAVQAAVQRLTQIIKGRIDPVTEEEKGKNKEEKINPVVLTTRRINAIIARFSLAREQAPNDVAVNVPAGQGRQKILPIKKASMKRSKDGGSSDWTYKGLHASWTEKDMVPGDYEVILRYSCGEKGGGKAVLTVAGKKFNVVVPKGDRSSRKLEINAGQVRVSEAGMDVRVDVTEIADGADYLWDLQAVVLQPAGKRP